MKRQSVSLIMVIGLTLAAPAHAQWGYRQPQQQWGGQPQQYGQQPQPYGQGQYGPQHAQPQYQQQYAPGGRQPIRKLFVGAGIGFGVTFAGGQAFFRAEESVGYHVFGVDEHPGLFVALTLVQGVANQVLLDFAARIGFDAVAWQDSMARVQVTPFLGAGVGLFIANQGFGDSVFPGAFLMPGLEVAVTAVNGFLTVWYRPISFDILIRDNGTAAYAMMAGVNLDLL